MMMLEHTDKRFEEELKKLKESILKTGALVENMVARSMTALVKRDSNLAREIIGQDKEVNMLEMEIDNQCLELLALHQPAASDLRFLTVGLKISTDLERIGDLAVNICEQAIDLNKEEPLKPYIDLPVMSQKSLQMLKDALDAFVQRNSAAAKDICEADDEVDALAHQIFDELVELMQKKPEAVSRGIRLILIARQLERVADHATNIAEEVTFLVEGEDIRHSGGK